MNINEFLKNLSYEEKEKLYIQLCGERVYPDVKSISEQNGAQLTHEQIAEVALKFAGGDFDCNLSYWENIQALINEVIQSEEKGQEYSEFEKWAYEWYRNEWCHKRNSLFENFDSEIGVNGECYVCMDEFVNNHLNNENVRLHYSKLYAITCLFAWISEQVPSDEILKNELLITEDDICYFLSSSDMIRLLAYNTFCHHGEEWLDSTLKRTLEWILDKTVYYDNFVKEFIIEMGLDMHLIQCYIEIPGALTKVDYTKRLVAIGNRCKELGVKLRSCFIDYEHLDSFWYKEDVVACVDYRGCQIELFVRGKSEAHLYDVFGYIKEYVRSDNLSEEIMSELQNDLILHSLTETGTLEFFVHSWVELTIFNEDGSPIKVFMNSQKNNYNVLDCFEQNFDDCIAYIDKYKRR